MAHVLQKLAVLVALSFILSRQGLFVSEGNAFDRAGGRRRPIREIVASLFVGERKVLCEGERNV